MRDFSQFRSVNAKGVKVVDLTAGPSCTDRCLLTSTGDIANDMSMYKLILLNKALILILNAIFVTTSMQCIYYLGAHSCKTTASLYNAYVCFSLTMSGGLILKQYLSLNKEASTRKDIIK